VNRFAVDSVDPDLHVSADPELAEALACIPVACHVFTNATRRYAERVLQALGVRQYLQRIFDIEFSLFNPKPSPVFYRRVVGALGLAPREIALVEDNPRNLVPALAMGMRCVYLGFHEAPEGAIRVRCFPDVPQALGVGEWAS